MWEQLTQLGAQLDLLTTKRNSKNEAKNINVRANIPVYILHIWPSASSEVTTVSLALRLCTRFE